MAGGGGKKEAKGYLSIDGTDWERGLKEAQKQTSEFAKGVGEIAKKATEVFAGISAIVFAVSSDVRAAVINLGAEGAADIRKAVGQIGEQVHAALSAPINRAFRAIAQAIRDNSQTIINAAQRLGEVLEKVVDIVEKVAGFIGRHTMVFDIMGTAIVGATAALLGLAGALTIVTTLLELNPFVLIVTAAVALVAVIARLVEKTIGWRIVWIHLTGELKMEWARLRTMFELVLETIRFVGDGFARAGRTVVEFVRLSWEILKAFGSGVVALFGDIADVLIHPWKAGELKDAILETLEATASGIASSIEEHDLGGIWDGYKDGFLEASTEILLKAGATYDQIRKDTEAALEEARAARAAGQGGGAPGFGDGVYDLAKATEERLSELRIRGHVETLAIMEDEKIALEDTLARSAGTWEYYAARTQEISSAMWGAITETAGRSMTLQAAMRIKLGTLFARAALEGVAVEIEAQGKAAAQKAAIYAAEALAFLAIGDFRGAAQLGAAAAGMAAAAGGAAIAAGVVRGIGGGGGSVAAAAASVGSVGAGFDRGPGTVGGGGRSSLDLTTRSAPENVTIYVQTTVAGPVVGDGGIERLVGLIVPRLRDLVQGGAF